ncbi:uncharacterized protein BYT42DRAFT_647549 [Radiomyces spectabilis]|uniref:uncharacterized protein n=1 Tax=Radiomyces spectabilis TaxID=64574 RepID=UPI002220622F|nr:uncharacterized protein BYT42DRAFT_647549 [Radiomyces spectabilis]KAI8371776.1 hypothetical protein BYT42DRAFT_647549 [Radiomyces spectabilis]
MLKFDLDACSQEQSTACTKTASLSLLPSDVMLLTSPFNPQLLPQTTQTALNDVNMENDHDILLSFSSSSVSDPLEDEAFLAFLSSSAPSSSAFPETNHADCIHMSPRKPGSKSIPLVMPVKHSMPARNKSNARLGYCQHPKHIVYRQQPSTHATSTPRRGRPPKGTKTADKHLFGLPGSTSSPLQMTVRPLPKRLEAVVGHKNIRVCLTCLKRTDADADYLAHPFYIAPQTGKRKCDAS